MAVIKEMYTTRDRCRELKLGTNELRQHLVQVSEDIIQELALRAALHQG